MKIGIMGGTFDPIHLGHLAAAEEARVKADLDEVIFVPAGHPWMKEATRISPAEHRLEMVRLAIEDRPYFSVSSMEVDRPGPTYTADTLSELAGQRPGDELYLIMGWGSLKELPKWYESQRILKLCKILAVPRPGVVRPDLKELDGIMPGMSRQVTLLNRPFMEISATDIRGRTSCCLTIGYLVPKAVEKYILEHKLYVS